MDTNQLASVLPDLLVLVKVVEQGSFSAAARLLGSTPSAVSRQMARLERTLGSRLLERTTRRLRLTEAGQADYQHSQSMLEGAQAELLRRAERERQNILTAGATSSGKTTLANALLAEIAATGDRVLVLEDTIELQCAARDHVPLRTRAGVVSMTELVRATMRLRPDRVIVGEVRGGEALDLVKVWGTGHPGGIATIHAGSALGALLRLEQLILEVAVNPPRALIAEAVNVVIHIAGRGRKRRVESIARVVGFDGTGYRLADALETPFPELMPVPLAADAAAPSSSLDLPGELP